MCQLRLVRCGAVLPWYRTDGQAGGAKSAAAPLQCVTGRQFFPNALPYQPANPSLLLQETKAQKPTNPLYHAIWPFHISLSLPPCVVSCLGFFRAARARQGSYTPPRPSPTRQPINQQHTHCLSQRQPLFQATSCLSLLLPRPLSMVTSTRLHKVAAPPS